MKAALAWRGTAFPKTHDVSRIVSLLPSPDRPSLSAENQDVLTRYATVTRYPTGASPMTMSEARRAVALARRVRREIRKVLPKSATVRKKK